MNYDPNLTCSGNHADKTVKLVFGQWEYRKEITVVVHGNTRGLSVLKCSVGMAYEDLPYQTVNGQEFATITMTDAKGDTLEIEDEDCDGEDWLADLCIGAEIVDIQPEKQREHIVPPSSPAR